MSKKNAGSNDSGQEQEVIQTFTSIELEEKLERMKKARDQMVEEANRNIAQLEGAIGFITQLLAGKLEEPIEEEVVE